jgi:hypothetical protein
VPRIIFGGWIYVDEISHDAAVDPEFGGPAPSDRFLATSSGHGVLQSCPTNRTLYQSMPNNNLYFYNPSASTSTNLSLYAPWSYLPGSSVHHLDERKLYSDCAAAGVSSTDCSDLVTYALPREYTQHVMARIQSV